MTSFSTVQTGIPTTIFITKQIPASTSVSTSFVTTPVTSVSIYTQVPRFEQHEKAAVVTNPAVGPIHYLQDFNNLRYSLGDPYINQFFNNSLPSHSS